MKVRMRVQLSGTRDGKDWPSRGSVMDLPDAEAVDYINAGIADEVTTFPAPVETATLPATEERRESKAAGPKPAAAVKTGLTRSEVGF